MTTTLENVVTALKTAGYKVNLQPQETLVPKELYITLESIELEVETSVTYFMTTTYEVNFISDSIVDITTMVPLIINIIDKAAIAAMPNIKSVTPTIDKLDGTLYKIAMKFSFKEVITIV